MLKLDGKTLPYDKAFTHDGMQYPSNWLRHASLEEKRAIGISEVPDPPAFDAQFYRGVDRPKPLNDEPVLDEEGNDTGSVTPGLKTVWKQRQEIDASRFLEPSDWRVIKAAEVTAYSVEANWLTYRAAVRSVCNTRQAEIDACKDVPALQELLFGPTMITRRKTDSEGKGLVEPDTITVDGKEETNPKAGQPVMETVANPAVGTAWPTPIE
jgi:hypothetical protein|tara:strand:- start:128 stop:760 length:633 start_codon:yes stop_codon:yes gene_type:complete